MTEAWRGAGWRKAVWGGAGVLLLLPLVAMRLTAQVAWGAGDVAVFALMLAAVCGGLELAVRRARNPFHLAAAALALATAFLLVWMNLAVGIIGSEDNPANLIYFAILALGLAGAAASRLRPRGMAAVMTGMALAGAGVAAVALWMGEGKAAVLTLGFAGLWLASALLFRRAARTGKA